MRILALKQRRLGDTILWTAALQAVTELPGTEVDIAYPAEFSALFEADPRFRRQIKLTGSGLSSLTAIRSEKYDCVLNFHASPSSAWLARLSGAREKVIHSHDRHPKALSSISIPDLGKPMKATERDLNVVRAIGWKGTSPSPKLYVAESLKDSYYESSKPLLLVAPFASRASKQWPVWRYRQVAQELGNEWDVALISEKKPELSGWRGKVFVTPTLREALGVMSAAKGFVGSDSGLKHMAAALGVPTLTLFGPESMGEWHCYSDEKHRTIQKQVPCRSHDKETPEFAWCGEGVCPLASHACMNLIGVDEVRAEISRLC